MLYVRPTVMTISPERIVVRLPLRRRNKNHWGSMYFGALSVGADCAVGMLVMQLTEQHSEQISLIFKDCHATFHKRAVGDVDFCCAQGNEIAALIAQAAISGTRVEMPVTVTATVPAQGTEPVATFVLTLSLKRQS